MAAPKPGGFKMSLGGLKNKPGFKAAAIQKETKKPRLALGEDGPDDSVKQQEISGGSATKKARKSTAYTTAEWGGSGEDGGGAHSPIRPYYHAEETRRRGH
jgi:hypothetical protein